jgi:hypothetical protein
MVPPSPSSDDRTPHIAAACRVTAKFSRRHNEGHENLPASAAETNTPGKPPASKNKPRIQSDRAETPPCGATLTYCGHMSQVNTHLTSKRPSSLEGCEADCILAPKRGNESALLRPVRDSLVIARSDIPLFHGNHRLRLLGRRRLSQARNLSDMKRPVGAVSPEQTDAVDRTHR